MAEENPTTPPVVPAAPVVAPVVPAVEEWKPPTKAEYEAVQAKLSAANAESAGRRVKITELERKNETDAERVKREALEEATSVYKPTAIRASAKSALLEADAKTDRVAALAGLLDVSKLDIDEKGEIAGLDAEVKRVKAEYPEFFKAEGGTPPRPGKLAAGGRQPAEESQAPWDIIAARHGG
jgi:hypothetical protein